MKSLDEALDLIGRLAVADPWSWSQEGLDDVCIFCDSHDRTYANGRYSFHHESGCAWIEAMEYLGRPHAEHTTK